MNRRHAADRHACALRRLRCSALLPFLLAGACAAHADVLRFGDAASEHDHRLSTDHSDVVAGALGESARRLLPLGGKDWRGGSVSFDIRVDPKSLNYVTLTLWGGEENHNRLVLSCDGKQIGTRHLGDTDLLDIGSVAPMYAGRFFHNTSPLPLSLTQGKQHLACRIDSTGTIWPYGQTFDQFQKPMTGPSRGMYALTVHTDPFLAASALERKGRAPTPAVRPAPGVEVLTAVKNRVGRSVDELLAANRPLHQPEMLFLARAYDVDWTHAYRNDKVGPMLVRAMDDYFRVYRDDLKKVIWDPSTYNPSWFGLGQAAWAIMLRAEQVKPFLDEKISDPRGGTITRRDAWVQMLASVRDWQRTHRRYYTNQSMIVDTYGIYLANRGIALLDPAKAMPEQDVRRYLYEAAGLQPWRGDDLPGGGHRYGAGGPDGTDKGAYKLGQHYYEITDKGLSRELGYVGNYGEVLDWLAAMYDATRPGAEQAGDPQILAQLLKIAHARAYFRYPLPDADGYRAMSLESVVGWRDVKYPGDVVYAQRPSWDASAIEVAAITRDPAMVAYVQQMFADNQFFHSLVEQMKTTSAIRVTAGLLPVPGQYEALAKLPPGEQKLPMSDGQPDFVFSDEEDGVVAVKTGNEIFYASLYWRALNAVNDLARVHYMTPTMDRMAVVHEQTTIDPSGHFWKRPEDTLGGSDPKFGKFSYPNGTNATLGEQLPIARYPDGVPTNYGDASPYAGKAEFYTLRYGPFIVAMNTTTGKSFDVTAPAGKGLRELVSKRSVAPGERLVVGPRSTVVLYAGAAQP
jgi:hypothetical protein